MKNFKRISRVMCLILSAIIFVSPLVGKGITIEASETWLIDQLFNSLSPTELLQATDTENINDYAGKTLSILGDSISTFSGVSNNTAYNSTIGKNSVYYSAGSLGVHQADTWWQQTADVLGMELLVNNSWSGSCVLHTRAGTAGAYVSRCEQLHNDHTGEEPDVIVVFLGTNDFSYYQSTLGTADINYDALITDRGNGTFTYASPTTTCEAYAVMLHKMINRYPDAEIYCMTMTARRDPDKVDSYADVGQPTVFNAELAEIIEKFGCTAVDLENCGIDNDAAVFDTYMGDGRVHPNASGMDKITEALIFAMLGKEIQLYDIKTDLIGVSSNNAAHTILSGSAYTAKLTGKSDQVNMNVTVTMGGVDVTDSVYSNGMITIESVTGDIVVTAVDHTTMRYRWEYSDGELVSVGGSENVLTKLAGCTTDGIFTDTRYQLENAVMLRHSLPWIVEWKGEGSGGFMLASSSNSADAPFFFRRAGNYLNAFGDHDGSKFNNYGVALNTANIDGSKEHVYRLVNRIADDGSNMVYLYVDGKEIGALNHYYVGGTSQNATDDWISGKDFSFSHIGTTSHPLTNYSIEYLRVCEGGIPDYAGKTIACVGDSITYGVGVTKDETDYVTLLAQSLEMDYIRLGASGTTLCAGGHATCNIGKLTEGNLAGADVVTILMGINDFVQARAGYYTLGSIDSTDTSTFHGAVHMWCRRIEELRQTDSLKNTEFYFMTPVITSWNNSVSSVRNWDQSKANMHGYTLRDLCNAIIEVCALYDIPVIDLNLISGLYYNSAEDNTVAEFGGDGAHPGAVGHQMMADAIQNALLQNNLHNDHDHSYGSWVTTTYPDCEGGEQQRVCAVCTATESKKLDGKGHTYESGICTGCGAKHTNLGNYAGKVVSILGDSISTFAGYIPTADGFNREHLPRYPQDNLLTDVNETWWMQVISGLNAKLGINDSWRGATLCGDASVSTGDTGENAALSNLIRIQNLGSNGTPDVILLYGGTNDLAHISNIGTFDPSEAPAEADLTTKKWDNLADGFLHTVLRIRYYYPDAELVVLLPTYTSSYYTDEKLAQGNALMAAICEYYGVTYLDLRDSGVTAKHLPDGIHPGAEGMDLITESVLEVILDNCKVEAGENVVYSVKHVLNGAKSSLSYYKGVSANKSFVSAVTGEDLTVAVTMGGADITASVYADGLISIPEVTGEIVITAQGRIKPVYEDHLQQMPENVCAGTNLWTLLEHDTEYYTVDGWGVHPSGQVRSVTLPINAGDRLCATSFGKSGTNGGTMNGIRLTWFDENGVLKSISPNETYAEFAANGYLTAPKGVVAVNVVMWTNSDSNALYILNRPHVYRDAVCTVCGTECDHSGNTNTKDGDCTTAVKCSVCSAVITPALGHDFGEDRKCQTCGALRGDVTGEGKVTALDLALINAYVKGKIVFDPKKLAVSDTDCNGDVTEDDVVSLKNYILGK